MGERVTIWLRSNPVPLEIDCEEFEVTTNESPVNGTRFRAYKIRPGQSDQTLLWLDPSEIIAIRSITVADHQPAEAEPVGKKENKYG